jgi:hypothetical protein
MAGQHSIEIFPAHGRQVVRWDPADPASVDVARAEFDRLRAEGYALFALEERPGSSVERQTGAFEPAHGSFVARSAVPVQTDQFAAEATRIVAVKPVRGG